MVYCQHIIMKARGAFLSEIQNNIKAKCLYLERIFEHSNLLTLRDTQIQFHITRVSYSGFTGHGVLYFAPYSLRML